VSARGIRYVLDTDIITAHQAGNAAVGSRLARMLRDEVATTVITMQEQLRGRLTEIDRRTQDVARGRGSLALTLAYQQLQETCAYFARIAILPFDGDAVAQYLTLRRQRPRSGPGTHDLQIAAIALVNGVAVVTNNRRHFEQVPGLQVIDWRG
jgi:tRNA(fMet)-specific endonuclease VapC